MKKRFRFIAVTLALALFAALAAGCKSQGIYKTIGNPLRSEEFSVAFRAGDRLGEYMTAALGSLAADGTLTELSRKWFGSNMTPSREYSPSLESLLEEGIPERRLLAGADTGAPPMCYLDGAGNFAGFEIELIRLAVSRLGWTVEFSRIREADLAAQLGSGNIDCAVGGINAAAAGSKIASSPAYLTNEKLLVTLADSDIRSAKNLAGRTLAMTFDPSSDAALSSQEGLRASLGSIMKLDSSSDCFAALKSGGCDAIIIDSLALLYSGEK